MIQMLVQENSSSSVDLNKLSNVVNEVVRNRNFITLKTKVNKLYKKIPDATTLIHVNQYNTDRQNVEIKN